jgi:hypothetical protein
MNRFVAKAHVLTGLEALSFWSRLSGAVRYKSCFPRSSHPHHGNENIVWAGFISTVVLTNG